MSDLVDKFAALELRIAEERGPFTLFALFMREDAPDRWDLIVSAPWATHDKQRAVQYLVDRIKTQLGAQTLPGLARIVVVDPDDVRVRALNQTVTVEHGGIDIADSNLFGLPVKRAHIITSRPSAPAAA